jgi:hypothetical protein
MRFIALALILMLALSLVPSGGVSATVPVPNTEIFPNPVLFNGLGDTQVVEVRFTEVFNFFAADFRIRFPAWQLQVVSVESGDAFDGLPPVVRIDGVGAWGEIEFANTRLGDPILWADSLTLAKITFRSVVAGPSGGPFVWAPPPPRIIAPDGTVRIATTTPAGFTIQPAAAAGVRGQALWESTVAPNWHADIPVRISTDGGGLVLATTTGPGGYYPPLTTGSIPSVPAGGQIHINPVVPGRIPALETSLKNCPNTVNLTPHTVTLVGGDVAPLSPNRTGNNVINVVDLVVSAARFGQPAVDSNTDGFTDGDANRDNQVNIQDIVIIANNFNTNGPIVESCP